MIQIIQFIKGYISIQVEGYSTERFINLCGIHHILLWDIQKFDEYYSMKISLSGFQQIKSITNKTGTKVVVTKRFGLPFFVQKVLKRKTFSVGLIATIFFLLWTSLFIWKIEIVGNRKLTDEMLHDYLNEQHISTGMMKKDLKIEEIEKNLRNEFPDITWVSVKTQGSKLSIQIKENEWKEHTMNHSDQNVQVDLVADDDLVIKKMITRKGIPQVKQGDEVLKGTVLVQGIVPIMGEDGLVKDIIFCKSDADIEVEKTLPLLQSVEEKYLKKIYTGKKKMGIALCIGSHQIMLVNPYLNDLDYDIVNEWVQPEIMKNLGIEISLNLIQKREYYEIEQTFTKDEIKEQLENKIQKFIESLDEKGVQIITKNVKIKKYKGKWTLTGECHILYKCELYQEVNPSSEKIWEES